MIALSLRKENKMNNYIHLLILLMELLEDKDKLYSNTINTERRCESKV